VVEEEPSPPVQRKRKSTPFISTLPRKRTRAVVAVEAARLKVMEI